MCIYIYLTLLNSTLPAGPPELIELSIAYIDIDLTQFEFALTVICVAASIRLLSFSGTAAVIYVEHLISVGKFNIRCRSEWEGATDVAYSSHWAVGWKVGEGKTSKLYPKLRLMCKIVWDGVCTQEDVQPCITGCSRTYPHILTHIHTHTPIILNSTTLFCMYTMTI